MIHSNRKLSTVLLTALVLVPYTIYGASVPGGPTIAQVQNNYSFILPGFPSYGIAPGSLFVISGANLSSSAPPVLQSSAAPGLPESLNQTSISVTVNGVTTIPSLYYTSATQVAAVLPSTTPVGTGTITLTYNGQNSAAPIQVVQSALGLDTVYGNGSGQGVITDANYNLIEFTHPAQAGQTVILWGSGVGPDLSNDDRTYPMNQNNLTNIPMQVYIGGISANILYRGRSQYPGVDQIDVVIPLNVSPGCFVSVVAMSGSIVSNTVTIPVSLPIGPCSDEAQSYSGSQFQSLATGKANIQVGTILVAEGIFSSGTPAWNAGATFQVVQSGLYGSGYGDASDGSCVVMSPATSTEGPFQSYGLDAGTIAVTWPGGLDIMNEAPGVPGTYLGSLTAGPSDSPQGIQYSFVGTGGRDIGPFSSGVTLESPPLIWINLGSVTAVTRSQGVVVNWVDSTSGPLNDIEIRGGLTTTAGGTTVPVGFVCHAPVTAGSFAIPPSILMALPAGSGTLSVAHIFSAIYPANGPFDLFQATGRVVVSQNVTYN
jgi:uncharacterized protein (TIGR03437 family)